jgi:tricorn protease
MRIPVLLFFFSLCNSIAHGQINASLFRYPDISATQVTFVYGGDIWIVSKEGGVANKLTSSLGEESYPRFSPDGKTIAYSASYNGNTDIYSIPSGGGLPARLTYHSMPDRMVEWYPDGNQILFASGREEGTGRANQFFSLNKTGGLPEKLPLPYGELASFSPDGQSLAYVTRITENYPFKRYRGGFASDILVYNIKQNKVENITRNPMTDGKPAWIKNKIFYVSDAGTNNRRNIWVYDRDKKAAQQITQLKENDVNYLAAGPAELIFEAGGKLYIISADDYKYHEIKISIVNDLATVMPRTVNVSNNIQGFASSPDGKRAIIEARGELFNLPSEQGFVLNLTNSSGAFDRTPAWSPDGKQIAYWSDLSGENEIYIQDAGNSSSRRKLSSFGKGFGWNLYWSPDSKKIAFIDYQQSIKIITVATGSMEEIDRTKKLTYSGMGSFVINWSADSKWLTYSKTQDNGNDAVFVYGLSEKKLWQTTSGYYNDTKPVFDPAGKYIYFLTDRSFTPTYSNIDATWIYANSTQIAAASLDPSTKQLLAVKNDEVKLQDTTSNKPAEKKSSEEKSKGGESPKSTVVPAELKINTDLLESRVEIIPVPAGNIGDLFVADGKIIYSRFPNSGAGPGNATIQFFDLEKREEKIILPNVNDFVLSGSGKSILVRDGQGFGFIPVSPDQKLSKRIPTGEMEMLLYPKEEWKQIFSDTWRRYRDFFYDPNMHKVDWNAQRKQYGAMVEDAITRWDVSNIQVQLISELSAGHTYAGGGDAETVPQKDDGFLGIDWGLQNNVYQVKRIVRPAKWDNEVRSPLDQSGIGVKEGDYILAVNGRELDSNVDPYAFFEGLSGKTISLKVNGKPSREGAKEIIIKTLTPGEERRLRHLEWIESNRKKVEQLSNGQLGYMYMPNTGGLGQTELLRQFYAQIDKKGFVIDERFNAGGQLADRFIEMLNRPVLYNISWRDADVTVWPFKGNNGPKVMLINGWAGSGGDAFPWAFQQLNLGPIIGERTLGILVGPATGHTLIDGGFITVPDARLYGNTGKWFAEGYGIKPDFEVWDDPSELTKGIDPQLNKAVEEALKLVKEKPRKLYPRPPFEDRTSEGLKKD